MPLNARRIAGLILSLGCAMSSPVWAQATTDGAKLLMMSNMYLEGSYSTAANVCSNRFPEERARWTTSLQAWKKRNAEVLADIQQLDTQLSAAVRAASERGGLTQEDLLTLRTFGTVRMLGGLAEVQDPRARELCGDVLRRLDGDTEEQAILDQARSVARDMLTQLRREVR